MEPIDTKSSISYPVDSYFLAIKTTNLKLCSIRMFLASSSPACAFIATCNSSSLLSGGGSLSVAYFFK